MPPASAARRWRALGRQYTHGNVKRHTEGAPITLTASARIAIAAGREQLELAA